MHTYIPTYILIHTNQDVILAAVHCSYHDNSSGVSNTIEESRTGYAVGDVYSVTCTRDVGDVWRQDRLRVSIVNYNKYIFILHSDRSIDA